MELSKINWKQAWELAKSGKQVNQTDILFTNELIPWNIVQDLNDVGLRVPKHLIDYDDEQIDYSDIPPLDKLLAEGSYKEVFTVKFDSEIATWLHESNINYNLLLNDLLKSVYQSVKVVNQKGYLLQA